MASTFVRHFVEPLLNEKQLLSGIDSQDFQTAQYNPSAANDSLRLCLLSLEQPATASESTLHEAIEVLRSSETLTSLTGLPSRDADPEERALQRALANHITVAIYAQSMTTLMEQCVELEEEAEWWDEVERSRWNVAWYLLQTLPLRCANLLTMSAKKLRDGAERRQFFYAPFSLESNLLMSSLFPQAVASSRFSVTAGAASQPTNNKVEDLLVRVTRFVHSSWAVFYLPLRLTRRECTLKRQELENLRDARAVCIGQLSEFRATLEAESPADSQTDQQAHRLLSIVGGAQEEGVSPLATLFEHTLPALRTGHADVLETRQLTRPSRLVQMWPKLVLAPPIILSLIRSAYASREDLFDMALEAHDTVKAFVRGWLLEPVKDILNTVRTGAGEGMIVHKEGVTADLDSLERMSLSLAKDHLNYSDVQLRELSAQVKVGDITPVLKLYEQDIRAPVKSAMTGTLLRTLFIQIQKAKVDIDQALFGIDKLLKSQELTFAFVGVAPAFGIVYLSLGYFRGLWTSRSSGAYGGKLKRTNAWFIMRRIERLLTLDATTGDGKMLSTRAAGLLLVSVAHLQSYAEKHLPKRSRLREGFLQDVDDLSNPALTRQQKVRVVERMWRSWGHTLGWGRL